MRDSDFRDAFLRGFHVFVLLVRVLLRKGLFISLGDALSFFLQTKEGLENRLERRASRFFVTLDHSYQYDGYISVGYIMYILPYLSSRDSRIMSLRPFLFPEDFGCQRLRDTQ